jgi:type IV pilus assembly protein PilB
LDGKAIVTTTTTGEVVRGETGLAESQAIRLKRHRFGELLISQGLITEAQLAEAIQLQKKTKKRLGQVLVEMGLVSPEAVAKTLSIQLRMDFVDVRNVEFDEMTLSLLPTKIIEKYFVLPYKKEGEKLFVIMPDPLDYLVIENISIATDSMIGPVIGIEDDIKKVIFERFGSKQVAQQVITDMMADRDEEDGGAEEGGELGVDDAPVVKLVNNILETAIRERASDIHIEPDLKQTVVRMRIDGVLHQSMTIPRKITASVTSRLKIMASMDIAEKRVPQDGKIKTRLDNRDIDIRVSSLPTVFGEKLVMRILDKMRALVPLDKLGFWPDEAEKINDLIARPNGVILLNGPTGSGKTTTLYSILSRLNEPTRNITTVEDPVEYQLSGINQVNTNPKAGMTFASVLRSMLRQDPDVIMVGEIRDRETAEIAVQAALTGHLVLSTVHTNDAPTTISRLVHMGIEPFLISASLIGAVAQRLVRTICPNCSQEVKPTDEHFELLGSYLEPGQELRLRQGVGCNVCHRSGYSGRVGLYEIMVLTPKLREMVIEHSNTDEIREQARKEGMRTLYDSGMRKVIAGTTTIEEVLRVSRID